MILSASRQTDIPAFYGEWLVNRLIEGKIAVRNPFNKRQVSLLVFDAHSIDCIVFWTKNPKDFIKYLDTIPRFGYTYYFQFTLKPYKSDLESGINKFDMRDIFIELSGKIGK